MPTNPFFSPYSWSGTQELFQDLTIEAIQIHGVNVKYVPRVAANINQIFGDDRLSYFEDAIEIEMIPSPDNVENFGGEGLLMSKYGIELRDQLKLIVSKRRFEQSFTEKVLTEENRYITFEDVGDYDVANTSAVEKETTDYDLNATHLRPKEGDLVYFPMVDRLFEVLDVNNEELFYQFGTLLTYQLTLETFEYSSERLNTEDEDIDVIEDRYTLDDFNSTIRNEANNDVLTEDSDPILNENYRLENTDPLANNEFIDDYADTIIDVSESNPFGRL